MTDISHAIDAPAWAAPGRAVSEATAGYRLDRLVWCGIAVVGLLVLAAVPIGGFTIVWSTFAAPGGGCVALLAAAWFYRRRNEPKLASALGGTAQLAAFMAVGAPLSYIAASANLPLQDHLFDAADRALGIDWRGLLHWMNAHPAWHTAFSLSYMSFPLQAIATVLALALTARLVHLRVFVLAFMGCAIVTIAISALLPAQGVWGHYVLTASDHPAIVPATREAHLWIFNGLRDGSLRTLLASGAEGIITFPSLHAAFGLVFIFAATPVPVLRWVSGAVNVLMIVATPVDGGHYVSDVFAGLLIALLCWMYASRLAARATAQTVVPVAGAAR